MSGLPSAFASRRALVFGATGQIGRCLCARLHAAGWRIEAVSRADPPPLPGVRWRRGALPAFAAPDSTPDVVFSCGPLDLFVRWYADAPPFAARVVAFGSTSAATKADSADPAERALAAVLCESEAKLLAAAANRGAHATLLRPTLVYGVGRDRSLSRIATIARRTGFFLLPSGATGLRQPVHADDLAGAALAAAERPVAAGHIYDLPGGETLPYREMVVRVLAALRPPVRLLEAPAPLFALATRSARLLGLRGANEGVVARMRQDLVFDAAPAQRDLGYAPRAFEPVAAMFETEEAPAATLIASSPDGGTPCPAPTAGRSADRSGR